MVVGVAGLIDVMIDHAVEQQAVIDMLPGEQFYTRNRLRGEVRAHFYDDTAVRGFDDEGAQRRTLRRCG